MLDSIDFYNRLLPVALERAAGKRCAVCGAALSPCNSAAAAAALTYEAYYAGRAAAAASDAVDEEARLAMDRETHKRPAPSAPPDASPLRKQWKWTVLLSYGEEEPRRAAPPAWLASVTT